MLRLGAAVAVATVCSLPVAAGALARPAASGATHTYVVRARLSPRSEVPPVKGLPKATGTVTGKLTIDGSKKMFTYKVVFSGLSGVARSAEVRTGPAGKIGPIALFLCSSCKSGEQRMLALGGHVYEKLVDQMVHGKTYVNISTKKHRGGEVRGQLRVVG
jgi:CHRD domain